jgi:hypothetical protein
VSNPSDAAQDVKGREAAPSEETANRRVFEVEQPNGQPLLLERRRVHE